MLLIVKKDLFMRKGIALTRGCLAKYLLSDLLEVQQINFRKGSLFSDFRFEDKINNF